MKSTFFHRATICVVVVSSVLAASSCVSSKYELSEENLNTEIVVFQEGLALPLGKTAPVSLASLLENAGEDVKKMLSTKDGAYLFRMADTLDFSDQLSELTDLINIEGITVHEDFPFNLSNVDLSGLTIKVDNIQPSVFEISSMVNIPEIKLPELGGNIPSITTAVPLLDKSSLDMGFDNLDMSHVAEFASYKNPEDRFKVSQDVLDKLGENADKEMSLEDLNKLLATVPGAPHIPEIHRAEEMDEYEIKVPVELSLPKEIKSIGDITLSKDAAVKVDVVVDNSFFTAGEIDPEIDIDLHQIFHLNHNETGVTMNDHLDDHFIISSENGWKTSHTYHVESLAFTGADFETQPDGSLLLKRDLIVTAKAMIDFRNEKTSVAYLNSHSDAPMNARIDINFVDMDIENIEMEIEPVQIQEELEIDIKDISLPDLVEKVEYVDLEKPLVLDLNAVVPDSYKSLVKLEELEITFPEGLEVGHKAFDKDSRTISYKDVLLANGLRDEIEINRLYLPEPVNGEIAYNGKVLVSAVSASHVNSRDMMSDNISGGSTSGEIKINVDVDYAPELKDYSVVVKDYVYDVKIDPIRFSEPLPKEAGEMGKISVFLEKPDGKNNPAIVINIDYPDHEAIKILPKADEGLKVSFADDIVFEELPAEYNYDPKDNSINFTGDQQIPSTITLPISRLDIIPEPVPEKEGEYVVSGEIVITGGVRMAGMTATKTMIDDLVAKDASVSFGAEVPELKPEKLNVGEYTALIDKTIEFGNITLGSLPDMLKSIEDVKLKDVELNIEVDASSIVAAISKVDMTLELDVTLPKTINIEHKDVDENNVLHVSEKLNSDNKFILGPYPVTGLDLSDVNFDAEEISLGDMDIDIVGKVILNDADIELDALDGDIDIKINGSLCSKGSDEILIDKVNAVIDYEIDPVKQSVDLDFLEGGLGDKFDINLDINRFNVVLEVKTNLGVPVAADLAIIPYKDGQPDEANIKRPSKPLTLKHSASAKDTVYTKYWISNTDEGMPEGYDWVELDILSLLKDIPERIELSLEAATPDNAELVFEPESKYKLAANYAVEIPLELGSEFRIEYADTLRGLPEELGTILSHGSVALGGKVTSSLPIELDVAFNLLDMDEKPVPLAADSGKTVIKACNLDGSPAVTDLNIKLKIKEGIEIPEISAIELKFKATSGGHVGVVRENASLQVELNAQVPDGVALDLKDLIPSDSEDEDDDSEDDDNNARR